MHNSFEIQISSPSRLARRTTLRALNVPSISGRNDNNAPVIQATESQFTRCGLEVVSTTFDETSRTVTSSFRADLGVHSESGSCGSNTIETGSKPRSAKMQSKSRCLTAAFIFRTVLRRMPLKTRSVVERARDSNQKE
jgi:hypothetical protein